MVIAEISTRSTEERRALRLAKKFEFYDVHKLLKAYPDCYYYVVFGERSNGKTYSSLQYALEEYVKSGNQFAYLRRYAEDIRPKNLSNLFSGHVDNGVIAKLTKGEWDNIVYSRSRFYFERIKEDGTREVSENPCGFAFDLNSMEHYKSTSFPRITTVVFDEFMSRSGYLPNEFILFTNSLSTIIRHRDNVKIIMLGNTVNKSCPYFGEMGLKHIKDQEPGTVDVYQYSQTQLKVVCEYTGSAAKRGGKASDVYFAFDNPELQMITSGAWEIGIYPHLDTRYRPADVVMDFFIEYEDEMLHGEVVVTNAGDFIFLHAKTTDIKDPDNDIVYTTRPSTRWNYRMCLTKQHDELSKYILTCLSENKIFYSTNEVGEVMRNYVMWSDSFSIKN